VKPGPGTRAWWGLVVVYVLLLFGVQPWLGFLVDALKERWGETAFATGVSLVAVAVALIVAVLAVRIARAATPVEWAVLLLGGVLYAVGVALLDIPQERLHYAEYGLLSALVFLGLQGEHRDGAGRSAAVAIVAVAGLGWLDETLQGALWERRYFDWRDVELNVRAAALGVLLAVPMWSAWLRTRGAPEG
jgi:hypothetical protein